MKKREKDNLLWYEFELLKEFKEISHGVFTKKGGVSKAPFEGLNVSTKVGDTLENVSSNRKKLRDILALDSLVMSSLEHKDKLLEVTKKKMGDVILKDTVDALLTEQDDVGLCISHADCQSALFYDPRKRIIANAHCGWRGNVINIFEAVIVKFLQKGSDVKDIRVCISPSLGPNYSEFVNFEKELPQSFLKFQTKPTYFDLWEISYYQLKTLGVKPSHIEIARMCTYHLKEEFYSFRRAKTTGRNASIIALKSTFN